MPNSLKKIPSPSATSVTKCIDLEFRLAPSFKKKNLFDKVNLHLQHPARQQNAGHLGLQPAQGSRQQSLSFLKKGKNYVVSVSGGIALQALGNPSRKRKLRLAIDPVREASAKARTAAAQSCADPCWNRASYFFGYVTRHLCLNRLGAMPVKPR